ncbi:MULTISPECIES: protein-export chaperone SecB [Halomonas]|uniref:Protein-export protein SecB n=2 Tax=Halomonas TaxID=2745 RepID=A0ABQ0U3S0_9GAMM|nr:MULTISPECIES: protein-export chaperone SecB [Halomonas]PSJ22638.1 protein-export chaperone SecB [Halomonas sp. ND22Bw]KGE76727.1 preprotein translocase subunit SecB [Halomonas salina]MDR5889087.1 protein-export chaperone SecB [Halomonas salina]RAH39463.1 protein-export chaperone SecB [Halomonas sp. SL1]WJY07353.1 protein-export chaperone SecB [Halomonas halophila]
MAEDNNPNSGANGEAAGQQDKPQVQFALQRIYVKDISFEAPNSPAVFQQPFKPKVGLDLNTTHQKVGEDLYEVVIKVTAQVTHSEEGTTSFLAEIEQAGLFRIGGIEGAQLDHTLGAFCPNMLFPYARECIDNLVNRGGFPPLMLSPVNFEAIYAQKKQREAQQQQQGEQATQ